VNVFQNNDKKSPAAQENSANVPIQTNLPKMPSADTHITPAQENSKSNPAESVFKIGAHKTVVIAPVSAQSVQGGEQ